MVEQQVQPGFEAVETFANRVVFGGFIKRMIPLLVIMFAFVTAVLAFISWYFVRGVLIWVIAVAGAAACCALTVWLKKRQFDGTWRTATLQLSPWGAVLDERHLRIEMQWHAVRSIGAADLMAPVRPTVGVSPATIAARQTIDAATVARPQAGLIGAAAMVLKPGAPAMLRTQVAQNSRGRQVDPASGQPLSAILLAQYDPNWPQGRIGAWIRAYRPDLFG